MSSPSPSQETPANPSQSAQDVEQPSQLKLLKSRRFAPFFVTQFAGAFNDNLYKNTLLLLLVFASTPVLGLNNAMLMNLGAFLFIVPFFLFSAFAGQLADKYEKSVIIRWTKLWEVVVMSLAAVALWQQWYGFLLVLLFLMGMQSAFFGPVKYALLPQALTSKELVGGNALVEMGTFVAILLGTLAAGLLVDLPHSHLLLALFVVTVAVLGYLASRRIPVLPAAAPDLPIRFNLWTETWRIVGVARADHAVFLSVMAISWFWFLGASYLTQFPAFGADVLNTSPTGVSLLLAVFTVGIALGSMLCEKLSRHRVELGLVPLGSLGLSVFGIDLYFAIPAVPSAEIMSPMMMLADEAYRHVLWDLLGIGAFGGFFIVPLYAFVQQRTPMGKRARVIAANNILNALFMVVSALLGVLLLGQLGLGIAEFFLVLAIMNIVVALYVYSQVPDFALRFVVWMLSHTIYRVKHRGLDNIPEQGAVVLVCNHVSFMDALVLAGAVRRPVRFVMDAAIFKMPALGWFFRLSKTIPICSPRKNAEVYEAAFERIKAELADGNVVCIFPEGKLTTDGEVDEFKKGLERIVAESPVPVVPMALQGLWGSFFSHKGGPAMTHRPRRFWTKIGLVCGAPVAPQDVSVEGLRQTVVALRGDRR